MNHRSLYSPRASFLVFTYLWTVVFVGCVIEEQCEDDKMESQYCPLRPHSSFRMDRNWVEPYDVCESEILPICVTAPRRKMTTVTTLKPITMTATTTRTMTTTTSTTTSTSPPPFDESEECEESRSRCDMSMTWLTSKTTIDISQLTSRTRKKPVVTQSSVMSETSTQLPEKLPVRNEDERQECEESRSQCDSSRTWLTYKTTIDIRKLKVGTRIKKPVVTQPPIPLEEPTNYPEKLPVEDNDERQECEETRSWCDSSRTWLTYKTTIDIRKFKVGTRIKKPVVTQPPVPVEEPTTFPEQSPVEDNDEGQECEENRSRCDDSTMWLTSKTTIDSSLLKSRRKKKPTRLPKIVSQTSETFQEIIPTKSTEEIQASSKKGKYVEPYPNPAREFLRVKTTASPKSFVELQDVFKNFPVFRSRFFLPQQDGIQRGVGPSQAVTAEQGTSALNSWKVRKTLADVWRAEERFEALAAATQKKRHRAKNEDFYKSRAAEQREAVAGRLNFDLRRRQQQPDMTVEWDYFHPAM